MTIEGRTVLVTGASRGIGRAVARAFAAHGARVPKAEPGPPSAQLRTTWTSRVD